MMVTVYTSSTFAAVQDEDDSNLRFSVLNICQFNGGKSEEDLVENTEEIWSIPLNTVKNFEAARHLSSPRWSQTGSTTKRQLIIILTRTTEKADKQDVKEIRSKKRIIF